MSEATRTRAAQSLDPEQSGGISRRSLLAGAGAGMAALLMDPLQGAAQVPGSVVAFTHTTVVGRDAVLHDAALVVEGNTIAAIGPTDDILRRYPRAETYDGRGKALLPGLINCHAHLAQTLGRGFNEDFGFPNSARLSVQPASLLSREENGLMVTVGALECIRSGTTTVVESASNIANSASALLQTGIRCVFAESIRDRESGSGPMSPELLAASETPRFSARLRDQGLQRINDLFTSWHGKEGRISVFPAATLAEDASPRRTTWGTRFTSIRVRPRSTSWFVTMAFVRLRSSIVMDSSVHGCSPRIAATSTTPRLRCWAARRRSCRTRRRWPPTEG